MNRRNYGQPAPNRRLPTKVTRHGLVSPKLRPIRTPDRPGRNQPCPCLSGKKFKHCCKDIPTLVDTLANKIEAHKTPKETATT